MPPTSNTLHMSEPMFEIFSLISTSPTCPGLCADELHGDLHVRGPAAARGCRVAGPLLVREEQPPAQPGAGDLQEEQVHIPQHTYPTGVYLIQ